MLNLDNQAHKLTLPLLLKGSNLLGLGIILLLLLTPVEVGLIYIAGFGLYIFQPIAVTIVFLLIGNSILKKSTVFIPKEIWIVLGLWISYVISIFFAIDLETTLGGVLFFIPLLAICWIFLFTINTTKHLEKWLATTIWIGFFFALFGLFQLIVYKLGYTIALGPRHANFLMAGRPAGVQGEPNWFGIYTGMILAVCIPLWLGKCSIIQKPFWLIIIAILCMSVLLSGTRSAWIGLLACGLVYLLHKKNIFKKKTFYLFSGIFLLGTLVMSLFLLMPALLTPLNRIYHLFDTQEVNSQVRINTWKQALQYIKERPLTGYGLSAWEIISAEIMQDAKIVVIDGKSVPNIFLEAWLSSGAIGLAMAIIFCAYLILMLWHISKTRRREPLGVYAESLLIGFIMLITASMFTNAFKHNWFWVLIALSLATIRVYRIEKKTRTA